MKALEMEEEEVETLIENGNNGESSYSKQQKTTTAPTRDKRPWIAGIAIVLVLLLYTLVLAPENNNYSDTLGGENPAPNPLSPTTPSNNNDKKKNDSITPSSSNTKPQKELLYSKMATIVPDPEHVPITSETKEALAEAWGKWKFWDGDEDTRPTGDYCAEYQNRDIPGDDFPDEAWQVDAVFVNHLLNDGEQLVRRAMEAIFTEYGHGKPLPPEGLAERLKMFKWTHVNLQDDSKKPKESVNGGGWTTDRSFDGLVRRLLHAMMTNDEFVVVLGGHSAAAGHGNHFHQSYMMQFHRIMAPIFARLGVKLRTRNMAQGGLGTIHTAMGSGTLYGDGIDLLIWDSGMTENNKIHQDFFLRQGLLGGKKVPVVWGGDFGVLLDLHNHADVDVGEMGSGMEGILEVTSAEQAKTVPYAARYMKCSSDAKHLCDAEPRFCTHCWVSRDDIDPAKLFASAPGGKFGGQVKWHPGWRVHQLIGRVLAYAVLDALQVAIQIWSDGTMGGPPLNEDAWHVTKYYENIRNKLKNLGPEVGQCHKIADKLPERMCQIGMKGATLHTPRANPEKTSLTALLKPAPNGYVPFNKEKVMYEGPNVHNKCYDIPEGEVDVVAIVSGRRRLERSEEPDFMKISTKADGTTPLEPANILHPESSETLDSPPRRLGKDDIVPGKGWEVGGEPPGKCDGEYDSICGRNYGSHCPLSGHHDSRGFLIGNEYSGWLVMELPEVKEGIIVLKMFTWTKPEQSTITEGWTSVNNEGRRLGFSEQHGRVNTSAKPFSHWDEDEIPVPEEQARRLAEIPDTFVFDFAINGKVTSWNKDEFLERKKDVQRVVETWTLLDDASFTSQPTNVELAIRMRGCGRACSFGVTHVYWA